eukprot:jgi/Undpi1/10187/HiC_scaffold_28.g12640.m1
MFRQHHQTVPGEQDFQVGYSVVDIIATHDANLVEGGQGEKPKMFMGPSRQYDKDLNGPSIGIPGLVGLTSEDSAFIDVSAKEIDNYTGNTINNNSLAIFVDRGASEHYFHDPPGLRGRLNN